MSRHPMTITYTLEKNEDRKTYRLVLRLPAEPIWEIMKTHSEEPVAERSGYEEALALFPDPQMIKEIFASITNAEQNGFIAERALHA